MEQRFDVSDYLKGECVSFISQDDKGQFENFYSRQPVVYNDSYLVILTSKSTDPSDDGYYDGRALVFKRVGGNFEFFYDRIKHILPYRVLLTNDNQLILCGRRNKLFSSECSVLCYDLNKGKIEKVQTITPPTNIKNQLGRLIDSTKHDVRFGSYIQIGARDQTLLVECRANYRGVLDESIFDKIGSLVDAKIYLVYKRVDNQWGFSQSTSELLPCSYYVSSNYQNSLSSIYDSLSYVTNVYIDDDRIQFSSVDIMCDEKHLLEFTKNKETNLFEYSRYSLKEFITATTADGKKVDDTYDDSTRINYAIQSKDNYALCVMNKSTELGIVPSFDDNPEVILPKWIIPSGNKRSMDLMVDYYKKNTVADFISEYGLDNFYDFTNYVPVLFYSIYGDNLVVSYVFMD